MSKRTQGAVLVGRMDQEYYFVESVFEHKNGFRGCTGTVVYPVSDEQVDFNGRFDCDRFEAAAGFMERGNDYGDFAG